VTAADQEALWDTAMRRRASERLLEQASAGGGVSIDDAPIVREIEERHAALVAATDSYERVRLIALTIGTVGALGAVGMANLEGPATALPLLLVALFRLVLGLRYRRSVDDAARAERNVLRQAGADDYAAFHYERVSTLLDTDRERRAFMRAVGDHRRAVTAWSEVAGPVPLAFALGHEREVRATAGATRDARRPRRRPAAHRGHGRRRRRGVGPGRSPAWSPGGGRADHHRRGHRCTRHLRPPPCWACSCAPPPRPTPPPRLPSTTPR
jgi:hypothetical protein